MSFIVVCLAHRHLSSIDCLSFVMCLLLAPVLIGFFSFLLQPLTVLMKQTRQAVRAIRQSIIIRCLWFGLSYLELTSKNHMAFLVYNAQASKFSRQFTWS